MYKVPVFWQSRWGWKQGHAENLSLLCPKNKSNLHTLVQAGSGLVLIQIQSLLCHQVEQNLEKKTLALHLGKAEGLGESADLPKAVCTTV